MVETHTSVFDMFLHLRDIEEVVVVQRIRLAEKDAIMYGNALKILGL